MNVWQICGCCAIFVVFSVCFFRKGSNVSFGVGLALCLLILLSGFENLFPITKYLGELSGKYECAEKYVPLMLKCLGIGGICSAMSEICRENGEGGVGAAIEFFAKGEILVLALPSIKELFELALGG